VPEPRSSFASARAAAGSHEYDYLVIGGGHNGLVAANYLASSGATVLVLEQRPYLAGMAATQPYVGDLDRSEHSDCLKPVWPFLHVHAAYYASNR
jgi:choline dehydrogenase-like flavoprotein